MVTENKNKNYFLPDSGSQNTPLFKEMIMIILSIVFLLHH